MRWKVRPRKNTHLVLKWVSTTHTQDKHFYILLLEIFQHFSQDVGNFFSFSGGFKALNKLHNQVHDVYVSILPCPLSITSCWDTLKVETVPKDVHAATKSNWPCPTDSPEWLLCGPLENKVGSSTCCSHFKHCTPTRLGEQTGI